VGDHGTSIEVRTQIFCRSTAHILTHTAAHDDEGMLVQRGRAVALAPFLLWWRWESNYDGAPGYTSPGDQYYLWVPGRGVDLSR
jgi:hypothetical protein